MVKFSIDKEVETGGYFVWKLKIIMWKNYVVFMLVIGT
jgi:hypothetical protein